jgi:transposase, IS5 family
MRQKFIPPMLPGILTPISDIEIPKNFRSRLYATLIGLQEIYKRKRDIVDLVWVDLLNNYENTSNDLIDPILEELGVVDQSARDVDEELKSGAPGMTAWQILVAVTLRQALNATYDDLEVHFNQNNLLREFLQIPKCDKSQFSESRLGKNCRKISPKTIDAINEAIIQVSMDMGFEDGKDVRADSFACKTNIHYPSDTKAIEDACRKVIELCVIISGGRDGWRQNKKWKKDIKACARKIVQVKRSKKSDKANKNESIKSAYKEMLDVAEVIQSKAFLTWENNREHEIFDELGYYMCSLEIILDLCQRRILQDEKVDVSEKIFSIFEPHTELIHRGKFPIAIEYGHRVFVAEGRSGIILDHRVMENGVIDQAETLPMLERLNKKYGKLNILSVDKGYNIKGYNPSEQTSKVNLFALPSKGYKNKAKKEFESSTEFVEARMWRAGVESCISGLMRGNGMDKCRDRYIRGLRRWVSAGVLARNLITLGRLILAEERSKEAS